MCRFFSYKQEFGAMIIYVLWSDITVKIIIRTGNTTIDGWISTQETRSNDIMRRV